MLQIIGVTCKHLENIDIWKSTNATDSGIRMFLGLDAERPFRVCSTMRKVAIKDTSITDIGAFNLMIHCENLDSLEFSQDSFLQQLLWRISENYVRTKTVFNLKTMITSDVVAAEDFISEGAMKDLLRVVHDTKGNTQT